MTGLIDFMTVRLIQYSMINEANPTLCVIFINHRNISVDN